MNLGKYEILAELGRGGFGTVYQARDLTLERTVALKVLHPQLAADLEFVRHFQREAKSLASLEHPYILPVYEFNQADGLYYIAMRYLPGGSLADRLSSQGPLPEGEVLAIARQLVAGLQYAHGQGMTHCDIKPNNILFDGLGNVLISDFGLARAAQTKSSASSSMMSAAAGTPSYMPPEMWDEKAVTSAVDQYSLACVLSEALTGKKLFDGETTPRIMMKHFQPLVQPEGIPTGWRAVLAKALSREPGDRYPNLATMLADLESSKAQITLKSTLPATPWKGALKPILLGIGLFFLFAIFLLWWGNRARPTPPVTQPIPTATTLPVNAPIDTPVIQPTDLPSESATNVPTLAPPSAPTSLPTSTSTTIPTSSPTPGYGETRVREKDGMLQIYVPAGTFTMGREMGETDEKPVHEVYLDGYWIDKFEVTQAQYEQCSDAGACDYNNSNRSRQPSYADHPAVYVTWAQANAYCLWAGGRLPTEAEWEKAARGDKDTRSFPWGEGLDPAKANFVGVRGDTAPVGSYPDGASPYGVLDMAGNVWEWVMDWYAADYYANSPESNPTGPSDGFYHVIRGGSWVFYTDYLRVFSRYRGDPDTAVTYFGFRCVTTGMEVGELNTTPTEPPTAAAPIVTEPPNPEPGYGETRVREKDGMVQVYVPAGTFTMGSNDGEADERPVTQVYLDGFWIDKFEVTNEQYKECVIAGACREIDFVYSGEYIETHDDPDYEKHPVLLGIYTWARDYCEWVDARLPNEAEWEKSARGDQDARTYPWGEGIDGTRANYCDSNCVYRFKDYHQSDGYKETAPVGNYPAGASPYGVMDMAGNVWEWTETWPENVYYGWYGVMRGGSWGDGVEYQRVSERNFGWGGFTVGFRCASSP